MQKSKRPANKRLFVGSLPYRFSEGDLLSLFVTEGKIIAVRIIHNKWGKSRGIGYVEYENLDDAVRAKEKFHNYTIGERTIIVDYSEPDPFLTEEGRQRHEEALKKKGRKTSTTDRASSLPRKSGRFNLDESQVTSKGFVKKSQKKVRQSVFDSRNYGAKVGAKFSARNKKNKKK